MSRKAYKVHAPSQDESGQPLCGTWSDYPRIAKSTTEITCLKCLAMLPRQPPQELISERSTRAKHAPPPVEKKRSAAKKTTKKKGMPWRFNPVSAEKRAEQTQGSLWLGHALHNIGGSLWLDDATVF